MNKEAQSSELIDITAENQYEIEVGCETALIEYIIKDGKIYLTHTEVPTGLQGQGVGNVLVEKVLQRVKQDKHVLVPSCSFVARYIDRHPEWRSLLSEGYQM